MKSSLVTETGAEWQIGLWGLLHRALVTVHGLFLNDLKNGGRLEEVRKCEPSLRMDLQFPLCLGFVFIALGIGEIALEIMEAW